MKLSACWLSLCPLSPAPGKVLVPVTPCAAHACATSTAPSATPWPPAHVPLTSHKNVAPSGDVQKSATTRRIVAKRNECIEVQNAANGSLCVLALGWAAKGVEPCAPQLAACPRVRSVLFFLRFCRLPCCFFFFREFQARISAYPHPARPLQRQRTAAPAKSTRYMRAHEVTAVQSCHALSRRKVPTDLACQRSD